MFSHTCDNYLQSVICTSHLHSFTTAHLFCTSVQMAYHHLNNEFSSVLYYLKIFINILLKHSKDRKGNFPQWDSNPMPLVCQMSTLTARPQRIPNLSQITYPSDSCSVMPVTIIYRMSSVHPIRTALQLRICSLIFDTFWKCMSVHPIINHKKMCFHILIWFTCKFRFKVGPI